MRSRSGEHYLALDHVRALAAFCVFSWHFAHGVEPTGYPVAFEGAPAIFPLALLDEGHTGVALFMLLSGYLFAKLLDGRSIDFAGFLWNRALRLLPPLLLAVLAVGLRNAWHGNDIAGYAASIFAGMWRPTLPRWCRLNIGGWSIAVEFHFYLLLPLLLALLRRSQWLPLALIVVRPSDCAPRCI